ncbi:MAG: hypothetical protein FJ135_15140 [Deltaproteobacteria bacterium]|nr:hypothetical protein [Deltaproteobacteria bacterium]
MRDDDKTQKLLDCLFGEGATRRLLFSPKETAILIGRAEQSLANDRFEGRGLPYVKLGRSVKYKISDILAEIEARTVDPEASRKAV